LVETIVIGITEKLSQEDVMVNLLTIYDKSDVENISDRELKELIKNI
jgi:hypothetical protein